MVSIPSRGFWFFEVYLYYLTMCTLQFFAFQSPRGDFGFLKPPPFHREAFALLNEFQSPRGDFGFLKRSNKLVR